MRWFSDEDKKEIAEICRRALGEPVQVDTGSTPWGNKGLGLALGDPPRHGVQIRTSEPSNVLVAQAAIKAFSEWRKRNAS